MPTITIDGRPFEVAAGRTILQAIDDLGLLMNGVEIPHYCWHPKLSIDGSCRLCQVEIEGQPKLQIACNTPVQDGMVIRTQSERVQEARANVMELLLLNHPLDCPICDQAGECKLQDYAFDYGVPAARTDEPRRPAKKAVSLGPTLVFDQERCILCRRCVRFLREVPKTGELGVVQRGDRSALELFPGSEIRNAYSMNAADICPVGALTTKDFRFKIRVWFLDDVPTVCNQCSNGCNIYASRANNKIYRYLPRRNDDVNDTWICDHGRLSYQQLYQGRLTLPRGERDGLDYDEAVRSAGQALRRVREAGGRVVGVASPFVANEDLFLFRELLDALGAEGRFAVPRGEADALLVRAEKAPNAAGARALGFVETHAPIGQAALALVLGHTMPLDAFAEVGAIVLIDTHDSELARRAGVVLPARAFAEREGTFVNHAGRVQRFRAVVEPRFEAGAEGELLARIATEAGVPGFAEPFDVRAVSERMAERVPAFKSAHFGTVGERGLPLSS
jgi:NADH-quinone oxidoreductase subunit G